MTFENLITVGPQTTIPEATEVLRKYRIEKLPVVDDANRLVGLITYRDITKIKDNPKASKDSLGRLKRRASAGPHPRRFLLSGRISYPFRHNGRPPLYGLQLDRRLVTRLRLVGTQP